MAELEVLPVKVLVRIREEYVRPGLVGRTARDYAHRPVGTPSARHLVGEAQLRARVVALFLDGVLATDPDAGRLHVLDAHYFAVIGVDEGGTIPFMRM